MCHVPVSNTSKQKNKPKNNTGSLDGRCRGIRKVVTTDRRHRRFLIFDTGKSNTRVSVMDLAAPKSIKSNHRPNRWLPMLGVTAYVSGALTLGGEKAIVALLTLLGGWVLKLVDKGGISDPALQKTSVPGHTKFRGNIAAQSRRNKAKTRKKRRDRRERDYPEHNSTFRRSHAPSARRGRKTPAAIQSARLCRRRGVFGSSTFSSRE